MCALKCIFVIEHVTDNISCCFVIIYYDVMFKGPNNKVISSEEPVCKAALLDQHHTYTPWKRSHLEQNHGQW